jgi:flagellar basal-body rod modification protein FlgD
MSISPITSASRYAMDVTDGTTSSTTGTTTTSSGQQVLGQADFLKLLAVQFQSQDPLKPMDDTAFIAQMAQFSSLQQTQTLTQQMTQLLSTQQFATANSYIGRQVSVQDANGNTVSGVVSGVDYTSGSPLLEVGSNTYALSSVLSVQPAAATPDPTITPDPTTTPDPTITPTPTTATGGS